MDKKSLFFGAGVIVIGGLALRMFSKPRFGESNFYRSMILDHEEARKQYYIDNPSISVSEDDKNLFAEANRIRESISKMTRRFRR